MKTCLFYRRDFFSLTVRALLVASSIWLMGLTSQAGVTLELRAYRFSENGYVFYTPLVTNSTPPAAQDGFYVISSPKRPTSGSWRRLELNGGDFQTIEGSESVSSSFDELMDEITNGFWNLTVTNSTATNSYQFRVNVGSIISNCLPVAQITFPQNNASQVTNQPLFTWTGPANWAGTADVFDIWRPDENSNWDYEAGNSLPGNQTSWLCPVQLPDGENYFNVTYRSNSVSFYTASIPTNNAAAVIPGWAVNGFVEGFNDVYFNVGQPANPFDAFLVARYNFENPGSPGHDTSGNSNDNDCTASSGGSPVQDTASTDAAVGTYAREFFGDTWICFTDGGTAFPNLSSAVAGNFTVTAWVKTTTSIGSDEDDADWGMSILYADDFGDSHALPLSITGNKAAFTVYDSNGDPTTVHSTTDVNDGNYHFVAVTRDQTSGLIQIFVDGSLENSATATTDDLIAGTYFDIASGNNNYTGLLDDLRLYSTNLTSGDIGILAGNQPQDPSSHTLKAHYSFENGDIFAHDYSGNENNIGTISGSGGGSRYTTNNPAWGSFSAFFDNNGGAGGGWLNAPTNLLAVLADSFTVSLWVRTTQTSGNDGDSGLFGNAGLVSAFTGPGANWVVPMALTGNKLAFATGGSSQDTLHSSSTITSGSAFVHLVVTRNRSTGEKKIYINGALDAVGTGSTALLDSPTSLNIGYNNGTGLQGVMDEIQFYSGVLSDSEVAFLYANPASTVPDSGGGNDNGLADAVDAPQFTWTTGGDTSWFVQTTQSHDNVDAAQSGAIGDNQSSWIQTTITGPGTLGFWWRVNSDDQLSYDYLEVDFGGQSSSQISGDYGWEYYETHLDAGAQTVRWTYYKDASDVAGADTAWLDEVNFIPDVPPTITFQPIDHTIYPGYPPRLVADATAIPEANWQWYKVGTGLIPGATSRYYSPTNAGAAAAGSYYAIALNDVGSANTRTAVVSFASAPFPADWTIAFKTQISGNFDNPRTNYGIASLVDASGNIYSANSFTGTNYQTTNTFISGPGRFAAGLFKHSSSGVPLWGRAITNNGSGNSYPQCVATAPGDGVYMSGVFLGTNYIGTNALIESTGGSLYLARFDTAGNVLWVRTFGGTNSQFQSYHQLASDPAGNVTISAFGNNLVDFGSTNILLNGRKGVLAQYDASGSIRWISQPSGWVNYMTYKGGRIYAVMDGNETNYIGGLTNLSDRKYAFTALNATNGQALWLSGVGSAKDAGNPLGATDDVPAVSVSDTEVFLSGTGWGGESTFGAHSVSWTSPNGQYLARYDTNGTAQLAISFGGTNVWPWAAVADGSGNVYVTGDFDGYAQFGNKTIGGARFGGIGDPFRGQTFVAKFDRTGNALWVRQAQSEVPTSFVNVRDINLVGDGVWICGFVNYYGNFGTNINNRVYGPETIIGFPFGFIYYYSGGYLAKVTENGVIANPITLLNPQSSGANFQFQFQTQSGFAHAVQYRTNLATGQNWQTYSNVTGNGTIKTIGVPQSLFSPAQQGFIRVSTP